MEIILRADVQHLGKIGEVVKVKDGYARNYLLPKGLAYPATEANKKKIAYEGERLAKQRATEKTVAEGEAARLAEVHLTFEAKVGEEDKLYGSVTARDIEEALSAQGFSVDRRRIETEPLKALGTFPVQVRLATAISATIEVTIAAKT
jgi:large subunit ribosomal protein L9